MRKLALSDEILLSIQQPARYIGGEVNMVVKDPSKVDVRFAMCFIWGCRSSMIFLTAETTFTANACTLRGQIQTKL